MTKIANLIHTARTRTTGGRDGGSRSDDGLLDVRLSTPGGAGQGTNPEQLFAAGWSACFLAAVQLAAQNLNVTLPADAAVDAEIDLGTNDEGYLLGARLDVRLPGIDEELAQTLVEKAHRTCPYSKATRGNIDVVINAV